MNINVCKICVSVMSLGSVIVSKLSFVSTLIVCFVWFRRSRE